MTAPASETERPRGCQVETARGRKTICQRESGDRVRHHNPNACDAARVATRGAARCKSAGLSDPVGSHRSLIRSRSRRASRGPFLELVPYPRRAKPPDVVIGVGWTATRSVAGWRGRIRTFDLLIQSQIPESGLADAVLHVIRGPPPLVFESVRCPSENESDAHPQNRMSHVPIRQPCA